MLAVQYMLVYFHRVAPAVTAPELINAFEISGTALGVLASAYFYSYGIMQIPVGILSDRWGSKKVIVLSGFVAAFGAISFGLSPTFSVAIISRIFVGIGVSALFIAAMKILANWFRGVELARVSGVLMATGGLGWLMATTPLALMSQTFGWRESFIAAGIFSLIPAVCSCFILADTPSKKGLPDITESSSPSGNSGANIIKDLKTILRKKHFWAIAIWFIFRGGALFGFFGLWAGPYLIETYNLPKYSAGNILSMIAFAMILLSPVLGHMSDKTLSSRKKVLVWSSVLNTVCWLVMLIFFEQLTTFWLYAIFFVMGITISSVGTIAIVATKELFPPEIAGTSMGTMNVFPFIGGIIFQPLIGYILDKTGKIQGVYPVSAYKSMIWLLFVTSILALISIMFSKETIKKI
jgi:sugar phosphate permease